MGLTRIFACAVAGALIPAVVLFALNRLDGDVDAPGRQACVAAQDLVAHSITAGKAIGFLPCGDSRELALGNGRWQVMGDVEIETPAGQRQHEAFLAHVTLGPDGKASLESLSLR
jgi:hypothetical protein